MQSQFSRVDSFPPEDRSSCIVQGGELFTLGEPKRVGGRLRANTAPGIDGVPKEILKEVIMVYPEIFLEAFNSCLQVRRFFDNCKKQRLILLRKGEKPLDKASSYRPICLLDTMGNLLQDLILQRPLSHMEGVNNLSENYFGFRKGRSIVSSMWTVVDIARKARRGIGKRKIHNSFNTAR